MKYLLLAATALMAAGGLLCAQTEVVRETTTTTVTKTVDVDNDQRITAVEFANSDEIRLQLARWDRNDDGLVSFDEFTQGTFRAWDKNGNGEIILQEFNDDLPYWYASTEKASTFAAWDRNADGEIHLDEFREGIRKTGLSLSFYQDITQPLPLADFQRRVYTFWDRDADGVVTLSEYNTGRGQWVVVRGEG